ncbi:hypothetical protein B4N89_35795 [Embleya scabrispora]|uniref:Uncharacterized protein n=1 Tax=Embleya scabrispora TaxID=159449 RepID=A0A1T3NRE4_9ACTN|nr:hypothetical protein [Embleya scabrispora]OPC79399.1 hypothetical protein B4N89_35795 [Embleya scabrispora]
MAVFGRGRRHGIAAYPRSAYLLRERHERLLELMLLELANVRERLAEQPRDAAVDRGRRELVAQAAHLAGRIPPGFPAVFARWVTILEAAREYDVAVALDLGTSALRQAREDAVANGRATAAHVALADAHARTLCAVGAAPAERVALADLRRAWVGLIDPDA